VCVCACVFVGMCVCVCVFVGMCVCLCVCWGSEDNSQESVLSFHRLGSGDQTQIIRLRRNSLMC